MELLEKACFLKTSRHFFEDLVGSRVGQRAKNCSFRSVLDSIPWDRPSKIVSRYSGKITNHFYARTILIARIHTSNSWGGQTLTGEKSCFVKTATTESIHTGQN